MENLFILSNRFKTKQLSEKQLDQKKEKSPDLDIKKKKNLEKFDKFALNTF